MALAIWLVFRWRKVAFLPIYLFTTLGYATHGLLDACTSYGTSLYWPFSDERVGWNIISIIDPLFTLPLLFFCLLAFGYRSPRIMRYGLAVALAYLAFGVLQYQKVESVTASLAKKRGHGIERMLLNPTIGNNLLWRSVYRHNGHYYIDAIRYSPLGKVQIQTGSRVPVVDPASVFPAVGEDTLQRKDVQRFAHFSQGFIYKHPKHPFVLGDLRYGTLPYDTNSLWGIRVYPSSPDKHVSFRHLRDFSPKQLHEFTEMLKGNPLYFKGS